MSTRLAHAERGQVSINLAQTLDAGVFGRRHRYEVCVLYRRRYTLLYFPDHSEAMTAFCRLATLLEKQWFFARDAASYCKLRALAPDLGGILEDG